MVCYKFFLAFRYVFLFCFKFFFLCWAIAACGVFNLFTLWNFYSDFYYTHYFVRSQFKVLSSNFLEVFMNKISIMCFKAAIRYFAILNRQKIAKYLAVSQLLQILYDWTFLSKHALHFLIGSCVNKIVIVK